MTSLLCIHRCRFFPFNHFKYIGPLLAYRVSAEISSDKLLGVPLVGELVHYNYSPVYELPSWEMGLDYIISLPLQSISSWFFLYVLSYQVSFPDGFWSFSMMVVLQIVVILESCKKRWAQDLSTWPSHLSLIKVIFSLLSWHLFKLVNLMKDVRSASYLIT